MYYVPDDIASAPKTTGWASVDYPKFEEKAVDFPKLEKVLDSVRTGDGGMTELEHLIAEQIKNALPLPAGWEYDLEFEERFNFDKKAWEFVATAKPVQRYKV